MWVLTAALLLAIPVQSTEVPLCTKGNGTEWYADTDVTITEAGKIQTFSLKSQDNITENCSVIVTINLGRPVGLRVEQFTEHGAPYSYISKYENGTEVHHVVTFKLTNISNTIVFSSVSLIKSKQPHQLLLQLVKGVRRISKFTIEVLPLLTMSSDKSSASVLCTPEGYIASHKEFAELDKTISSDNTSRRLTLSNLTDSYSILIEVVFINLGRNSNVDTVLEISSNKETLLSWDDTTAPKQHVINTTHIEWLTLELVGRRTDDFRGFLLKYSANFADETDQPVGETTSSTIAETSIFGSSSASLSTSETVVSPSTPSIAQTNVTEMVTSTVGNLSTNMRSHSPSTSPDATEHEAITMSHTTSATTQEKQPNPKSAFFGDVTNIAAVSATAGGVLLLVIVVMLACLICRKKENKYDMRDVSEELRYFQEEATSDTELGRQFSLHSDQDVELTNTVSQLTQLPAELTAPTPAMENRSSSSNCARSDETGLSDGEPNKSSCGKVGTNLKAIDGQLTAQNDQKELTNHMMQGAVGDYENIHPTESSNKIPARVIAGVDETEGEVEYAVVNKKRVRMEENELYGST